MNKDPLVSVIINCYNGERFLKEAIDSVYSQTFSDWEIILWDNASTDNTAEIAMSYDNRLKYFCAASTTTLSVARNLAIQKASGKYLAFLDYDDLFLEKNLEIQLKIFESSTEELGFVYGRCEFFVSDNVKKKIGLSHEGETLPLRSGEIFKDLCKENFVPWPSTLISREKLISCGRIPEHVTNCTDQWIFLHLSYKYPVGATEEICSKARGHIGNLQQLQYSIATLEAREIIREFLPHPSVKAGLKYNNVNLCIAYLKEKNYISAFQRVIEHGGWKLLIHRIIRKVLSPVIKMHYDLTIYD